MSIYLVEELQGWRVEEQLAVSDANVLPRLGDYSAQKIEVKQAIAEKSCAAAANV